VSQRRVYKKGRPDWDDEGEASATSSDPMATYGRLSVAGFRGDVADTPTGGAGPVERRVATPEELAAARAREAEPTHLVASGGGLARRAPVTTDAAMTRASRQRGAAANRERLAALRPTPVEEEEPAVEPAQEPAHDMTTPETEPPRVGLAALADALVEAMEAEGELEQATGLLDQAGVRGEGGLMTEEELFRAYGQAGEARCLTCDGAGWVSGIGADAPPSGEPGEQYQVQETCPDCDGSGREGGG
jgi:hypothetical protein